MQKNTLVERRTRMTAGATRLRGAKKIERFQRQPAGQRPARRPIFRRHLSNLRLKFADRMRRAILSVRSVTLNPGHCAPRSQTRKFGAAIVARSSEGNTV